MYKVGDEIPNFVPFASKEKSIGFREELLKPRKAKVVYINEAHRFYRVECVLPELVIHECFKF